MKDAKGHGSNAKPISGSPMHMKTNDELRFIQRDAHEAGRNAQEMGDQRGINKYADQVNDASTVLGYRAWGGKSDAPADVLASGPKSDAVPVHDSMTHNDQGHAWGSPEALKDFRDKYNAGRAAGRAKNMQDFGPRNHAAEQRGFNSGKREINRLRKQGK